MAPAVPVYLAGPDVFLADAVAIGARKQAICRANGLDGRFPLDGVSEAELDALDRPARAARIFAACLSMMDACDAAIANLTPFRGPSADVGTAFELGYLHGIGRPVFGYTSAVSDYIERVDVDGLMVEDLGMGDNLMLEGATLRSSRTRVVRRAEPVATHLAAFAAFEAAVALAKSHLTT